MTDRFDEDLLEGALPNSRPFAELVKNRRLLAAVTLVAAGLVGCTHSIAIDADEFGQLAEYRETGQVTVDDGEYQVEITEENNPHLVLETSSTCILPFQSLVKNCGGTVDVPLEMAMLSGDGLSFALDSDAASDERAAMDLSSEDFHRATLRLENYVPQDWQPNYGVGLTLAGPSMLLALHGQIFAGPVAIEVGGLPPSEGIGLYYGGFRLRPLSFGRIRPFLGSWINHISHLSDFGEWTSTGARLGVDIHLLSSHRLLLTPEVQLGYVIDSGEGWRWEQGELFPWGGLSASFLF